ncbi:MAG: (2Fe-2S) ferredoxin domain-containing protein [Betaproteobacteria bacterium]|nr:(2Fe-2S) ferredoxin domain-containing protein [Betaproteobacteria bacterium]
MSYYQHHLFFCLNQREDGGACCSDHNAEAMFEYAKKKAKKMGLHGKPVECSDKAEGCAATCLRGCMEAAPEAGMSRINRAGCFDRCGEGPVCVVYPDAVWYTYVDEDDLDEILESHLRDGIPVARLRI